MVRIFTNSEFSNEFEIGNMQLVANCTFLCVCQGNFVKGFAPIYCHLVSFGGKKSLKAERIESVNGNF